MEVKAFLYIFYEGRKNVKNIWCHIFWVGSFCSWLLFCRCWKRQRQYWTLSSFWFSWCTQILSEYIKTLEIMSQTIRGCYIYWNCLIVVLLIVTTHSWSFLFTRNGASQHPNSIEYHVADLDGNNEIEWFVLQLDKLQNRNISFQDLNQFTGIEWWNKNGNSPFPIRYEIEFSNVRYPQEGLEASESDGEKNIERMIFRPYDALVPNNDGYVKEYRLSFIWADFKDSCIRYIVTAVLARRAITTFIFAELQQVNFFSQKLLHLGIF